MYDVSGAIKFFLIDEFCLDIAFSYIHPEFETTFKLNDTKSLTTKILMPSVYLGLGGNYYLGSFFGFSIFGGADVGFIFPIEFYYRLEKIDGSYFEGKESHFGEPAFSGNLKAGLQYLIGNSIGGINFFRL
jgi:hypothetical protein